MNDVSVMKKIFFGSLLFLGVQAMGAQTAATDLQTYRAEREESLKKNWLVVAGLTWLKPGDNTVGSDPLSDVDLPARAPAKLGKIVFKDKKAQIEFTGARFGKTVIKVNGQAIAAGKSYPLATDQTGAATKVDVDDIQFFLIERANGVGVRLKDPQADTVKNFKGLDWWPENKKMMAEGKWKALAQPKTLRVPDIHGNINDEIVNGSVEFTLNGQKMELFPTRSKDDLFFVFKDLTTGKSSYGTGRFLTAVVEGNGRVVMDFNRAYNPPCAQIKYATCPMPPPENALKIAIEAGEKSPRK